MSLFYLQIEIEIPLELDADTWVTSIEQSMLLLLILGRWLMPKGDITRDQLSQLLFVYIGMASDIMELHILFAEPDVLHDELLGYCIMGVWSLSLLQFTLVLTATKARKPRVATDHSAERIRMYKMDGVAEDGPGCCSCCQAGCCESEVWSILIMVFFQDGPFLAVRLYTLITYKILSYNILFFTCKNALVILLQFYRLIVLASMAHKERAKEARVPVRAKKSPKQTTIAIDGCHRHSGSRL